MTNKRKSYPKAVEVELIAQVNRRCPLCGTSLFYRKRQGHSFYELAHIYPLNPSVFEIELLKEVPRLRTDVNHPDNLIPLCRNCHKKYDSPRTVEEYQNLCDLKRQLMARTLQHSLQSDYQLDAEITRVIASLYVEDRDHDYVALEYDAKRLEDKFDGSMSPLLKHKIRSAVAEYYPQIKRGLLELERESPTATDIIATQVKLFYLEQRRLGLPQPDIFRNIADWIQFRSSSSTIEAAEVVAAYYVQNCEVFG